MPLVSVISPQFVRIREDKTLNVSDIRISQVTDLVPVAMAYVNAAEMKLPVSEILQREVYTKELKGELLVRKFLLWKTNKEKTGEEYPGYVLHYTDFSPTRKSPLNREIRVSNSDSQIAELWQEFKKSYIKKGWSLHSESGEFIKD